MDMCVTIVFVVTMVTVVLGDPAVAAEAGIFSLMDIFIITMIGGVAVYWVLSRTRKQKSPEIKPLPIIEKPTTTLDSSFINRMKSSKRNVVVFYGSQTGTAEEFAGRLAKDCTRFGMKGMVADPEECEMEEITNLQDIDNSLVIFCMATYGEGDPTDNATDFIDWLKGTDADLTGLQYTVFALGNKTYEHYNSTGKYVDERLSELGAVRVHDLGLGDDDASIEEDFLTWREELWPRVCEYYGVEASGDDVSVRQYALTEHTELADSKVFHGEITRLGAYDTQRPPYDAKNPYLAPVAVNRELHAGGDRSCLHIELDISGSKLRYDAGDHVGVYPSNDQDIINGLAVRLNFDLDTVFTLTNVDEEASKKHPFPSPSSYRTALSHYVDITHPPNRQVLKELSEYAASQEHKDFLLKLSANTNEGKVLYNEWVLSDHRSILAVLEDLPSVQIPIDHLCELLPRLQARYYSISSSGKVHPLSIHITAVVVDFETPTKRQYNGVATGWLKLKQPANGLKPTVPMFVRKSQFRLPFKATTPVIMIGPGTGLAPFRGFLQERDFAQSNGKPIGSTVLYFGCRKRAEDYIYEEELAQFVASGVITTLHVAFSRDQDHKIYVQHLMSESRAEVWDILQRGGHIYVCGDASRMSKNVNSKIVECLREEGGMTESQAESFIKKLQAKGKYSCDIWS